MSLVPSWQDVKARVDKTLNRNLIQPVQNYFAPTPTVRTRDFIRELPTGIAKTGMGMIQNTRNFVNQAGNTFGTAAAYYNPGNVLGNYNKEDVPLNDLPTPGQMLGSTAGSIIELAPYASRLRGVMAGGKFLNSTNKLVRTAAGAIPGYAYDVSSKISQNGVTPGAFTPGLGTVFGGAFGYAAKPVAADLTQAAKDLTPSVSKEVRSFVDGRWMNQKEIEQYVIAQNNNARRPALFADELRQEALRIAKLSPRRVFTASEFPQPKSVIGKTLDATKGKAGLSIEDVSRNSQAETVSPQLTHNVKPIGVEPKASELIRSPAAESAPQGALKIARQELNVNNLNLTPEEKITMQQIGRNENPTRMTNKSVIEQAKRSTPLERPIEMGQTISDTGQFLATRQSAVNEMKAFSALQKSGATQSELEQALISTAKKGKTATSVGTDTARKFQAQKILADEFNSPMQKVLKLLDEAGVAPETYAKDGANVDFNNPGQVVDFYRKHVPAKFSEWLDVVRYNSMLSSPLTQLVNVSSNLTAGTTVRPIVKTLTGGVDFIGSSVSGKPQTQFAGEGPAYVKGYWSNVGNGWNKFTATMKGTQEIENFDMSHIPLSPGSKTEAVLSYPMRLLEGMDQFFMALGRGGEESALKYRMSKGVKVKDLSTAVDTAARGTVFRGDLMAEGQGHVLDSLDFAAMKILEARNSKLPIVRWAAKMTVPFLQTPTNLLKQGLEYTPGFGATTLIGNTNKSEQIAKQIFGASVFLGVSALVGTGRTTLGEPTNQAQKNEFRAAGMQPYSVKIGDTWVAYNKLHPAIAFPIYLAAVLQDNKENGKINDDGIDQIMSTIAKYGTFFSDQSYMKSMGGFLDAAKGGESAIQQLISNYWQQFVPFRALSGWVTRMIDDVQRKVDPKATFLEKQAQLLMLNIPGLSQNVPARLDQMGNPIEAQHNVINSFSPLKISTENPEMKDFYDTHQSVLKQGRIEQQIKDMLNRGETPPQEMIDQAGASMTDGRITPINGQFYAKIGKKGYVGFDTEGEAKIAINQDVFDRSGKAIEVIDGMVYRRDKNGNATPPIPETDYKERLYSAMQTEAYGNKDFASWMKVAQVRYQNLVAQMNDPTLDDLERLTIENKISTLLSQAARYKSYGGFTKPKARKKAKLSFKSPLSNRKTTMPTFKGPTLQKIRMTIPKTSSMAQVRPPGL